MEPASPAELVAVPSPVEPIANSPTLTAEAELQSSPSPAELDPGSVCTLVESESDSSLPQSENKMDASQRPTKPDVPPTPPSASSSPSTLSRHRVLQAERVLAAIEVRLRSSACATSGPLRDVSLEALGDAYRARLAGHALDNLDRAIISYRLAERRLHERPGTLPHARVLAKLGCAWYARLLLALQMRGAGEDAVEVDTHAHLESALDALDEAVSLFEEEEEDGRKRDAAYVDALLCRGLVCDRLYQTLEIDRPGKGVEGSGRKRSARNGYVKECIVSLERVLEVSVGRDNELGTKSKVGAEKGLCGVERAQAVMCLARAYSNVERDGEQVGKAVGLLASVDDILRGVEADGKGGEDINKMREDAEAQIMALSGSAKVVETRCVVC